jgi:hypothetical protein
MVVEAAPGEAEQSLSIIGARELPAQHAHEGALLVIGEPSKPERLAGYLLVLDQRWRAAGRS